MKAYWLSKGEHELRGMLEAPFVGFCKKKTKPGIRDFLSMGETLSGNGHVALQDFFLYLLRTLC